MGTLELTGRVEVSYSPEALQVAALNREATVAKRAGDWARACELLAQAKAIEGDEIGRASCRERVSVVV